MRSLCAYIDRRLVGTLEEGDDLWRFEYAGPWIEAADGFDLSPGLPRALRRHVDGGTHRPVQWYFDNLLPEELLRQAISKEAGIRGEDAFALLEYLGAESAGSLTLLPPGQTLPEAGGLTALPDEALSRRVANLSRTTLTAGAPKRMSLAGAQHKLLVVCHRGQLFEPEGATPSTHILKPSHPDISRYPGSVVNEYVTMRLAAAIGLPVPAVHIRYVPEPIYLVDRFDRQVKLLGILDDGRPRLEVRRLHIIDACQLLNRARTFKHSGASIEALCHIIERTTNKLHTRTQLFRWLIYNVVMANDDCHLKNLSFFMSPDGVRLADHYDLLATGAFYTRAFADEKATWPQVPMAIALPGARVFGEVSFDSALKAGLELGLSESTAKRVIKEVVTRVPIALAKETAELDRRRASVPELARVHLALETRFLHVLNSIIVREMLDRLSN
jgi:serine/threonine-protein kinase HipA